MKVWHIIKRITCSIIFTVIILLILLHQFGIAILHYFYGRQSVLSFLCGTYGKSKRLKLSATMNSSYIKRCVEYHYHKGKCNASEKARLNNMEKIK